MRCCIASHRIILYRIVSYRIVSYRIVLFRFVSYHSTSQLLYIISSEQHSQFHYCSADLVVCLGGNAIVSSFGQKCLSTKYNII